MKFDGEERALLTDTLADFMTLKGYRDSLVHVRLIMSSENKMLAFAPEKRGARYEISFSKELMLAVLSRLKIFHREMIAVGTPITERPPHKSVRADFPHTAPTSGA
jgi:hypothetical protein